MEEEGKMTARIGIMCFSPTNATRKICDGVALGMGSEKPVVFDMTLQEGRAEIVANGKTLLNGIDHLIVGAPVHVGKIPLQAQECLRALNGAGKKCTAVVVYGNRDYGAALYQMVDILSMHGFVVAAAGTFIGQHSYSDLVPAGIGRPDKSDTERAVEFGSRASSSSKQLCVKDIPVQWDRYSKSKKYSVLKASYNDEACVQCHRCAKVCPLGLISSETGSYLSKTARKRCIGCMACVRVCKVKARVTKANPVVKFVLSSVLKPACRDRKEPRVIA
jgi:Pyruvate/2-oxoacid:ferredoxin oxidoreductase delta subunit